MITGNPRRDFPYYMRAFRPSLRILVGPAGPIINGKGQRPLPKSNICLCAPHTNKQILRRIIPCLTAHDNTRTDFPAGKSYITGLMSMRP